LFEPFKATLDKSDRSEPNRQPREDSVESRSTHPKRYPHRALAVFPKMDDEPGTAFS